MAVEYQYRSWIFMRSVPMLDFDSTQVKPLVEFMFHPLHDVESLWWILWWYVSRHVLVDVVKEMSSEDWMEHRRNIKTFQRRYFSSGIDGSSSRLSLITTSRITNEVDVLSPLYIGRRHFLSPLAFVTLLAHEYQAVHDHPPCQGEDGSWRLPRTAFTDNLHVAFEKYLQKALCSTSEVGVTCSISDADAKTKVSVRLEINRHSKLNAFHRIHGWLKLPSDRNGDGAPVIRRRTATSRLCHPHSGLGKASHHHFLLYTTRFKLRVRVFAGVS